MNESLYDVLQQYEPEVTAACVEWQEEHGRKITEAEYGKIVEAFVRVMMELNRRGEMGKHDFIDPFDPKPAIDTAVHYVLDIGFKQPEEAKPNGHDR